MWVNPDKNVTGMKLDLGAGNPAEGENQAEGYVLQDVSAHTGIDLVCDIRDLKREDIKPCSKIRLSHVMEHFPKAEVIPVLKIVRSCLNDGGELEIIVPNFKWHAQLVMEGQDEQAVYYAFGGQLDDWDYHKTGFTPSILVDRLQKAGFIVLQLIDSSSITAIARKL